LKSTTVVAWLRSAGFVYNAWPSKPPRNLELRACLVYWHGTEVFCILLEGILQNFFIRKVLETPVKACKRTCLKNSLISPIKKKRKDAFLI
jgi:hypothetical protein